MLSRILPLLWLFFLSVSAQAAEITGQIKGQVNDTAGMAVPSALVVVTSDDLLGSRSVETDANGRFLVSALPVGVYRVEASMPGFHTSAADGVRLTMGGTATLDMTLRLAEAETTIVVEEEVPVVDTENVRTGLTLSADQMKNLPTAGRDYQSIIGLAPGVVGSGNANVRGGLDSQNQFFIDGVNITDPVTNTFSANMNYDAIKEVQVLTGGMDAEYGRALGGAVNVVTKSGGNELEVIANARYSDHRFKVYTPRPFDDPDAEDSYLDTQLALNVGGPIVKDKVWFFASAQGNLYRTALTFDNAEVGRPSGDDPLTPWEDEMSEIAPRDWKSGYLFGKVTAQPNSTHRIWVHGQSDPTKISNIEQYPYTLPSAETIQAQGGWIGSLGHIWMPSSSINVETQVTVMRNRIEYYPVLWDVCENWNDDGSCADDFGTGWYAADPDGFSYGPAPYAYLTQRQRMALSSALSWFVTAAGEHRVKLGVQADRMTSNTIIPGIETKDGLDYYSYGENGPADLDGYSPSYTVRYDNNHEAALTGQILSVFLQDVWQPVPRLTLRPGVRLDNPSLRDDYGNVIFSDLAVSPRFGVAFDLLGDGRTSVHAYYGRFVDPGFLQVSDLLRQRSQGYGVYNWDAQANDWSEEASSSGASTFLAHDDMRAPTSDAYDLGVTRAIGDKFALDVNYNRKRSRGFWEDDEVNLIWNDDATQILGGRNGTTEAIYRLRTSPERYIDYDSVEVSLQGRFDQWWVMGSYVWSRAYGTASDQGATAAYDFYPQIPLEEGYLSHDRTHAFKLIGTQERPQIWQLGPVDAGYTVGWNYRIASGFPYRKMYYNPYYAGWLNYAEPDDGSLRMPAISQLDLSAGLLFEIGSTNWTLIAECFNVFDDRTVTSIDTTYGDESGEGLYTDSDGEPLFGTPLSYQYPRNFAVGIRGEF